MGGNEECCCCEFAFCCKPTYCCDSSKLLQCWCCACQDIAPTTCMKNESQCYCAVAACAFPPDEEVPCMVALCCVMCYPPFGLCVKVGDVVQKGDDAVAGQ